MALVDFRGGRNRVFDALREQQSCTRLRESYAARRRIYVVSGAGH